jgi:hypothetical protein
MEILLNKCKPEGHKKKKSFPWIGLILVILGLAAMFYFIDPPALGITSLA